ncbi:MAG: HPr family phosphocarrier protein [Candidatus Omnitrophica bacterium]|nr:HPr family phosphocarrier protein [Candidatus Omnitrophota bacterium]
MVERKAIIKNKSGLHARPAALFVQIANKYDSDISIKKGSQKVNGKSIMGIMMLAAEKGSRVVIIAEGPDAKNAVDELEKLLLSNTLDEWYDKEKKKK